MKSYSQYFQDSIAKLKQENRYREFVNIRRIKGEFPYAINLKNNRKITIFCSNDYLGMGQNEKAINSAVSAVEKSGLGSGGTRNISGSNQELFLLEQDLATIFQREKSLCFTSGYVANDASIQALSKILPDLIIFSDEKNHASIISGIKNSKCQKHVFKHNDIDDLEKYLKKYDKNQPKLIIFESVYSMDGDFGKIKEIVEMAKKYNCLTFCDEVHGVGIYDERGRGYAAQIGFDKEIDIIQGTFAKAYGVIGGFIVGDENLIDAIRLNASGFIFSTSLPPMIAAAIRENVNYLAKSQVERQKLHENVAFLKNLLKNAEINIIENQSHIISIRIGDAKKAQEISQNLLNNNDFYVQHINYPTVDKGDERLRITISPNHSQEIMINLVAALKKCL